MKTLLPEMRNHLALSVERRKAVMVRNGEEKSQDKGASGYEILNKGEAAVPFCSF